VSVVLDDAEARVLAALVARALVGEAREHGARPTGEAVALLRRLTYPAPTPGPGPTVEALSVAEAARRMGCSSAYVRRLAAAGRIAGEKVGPVWSIRWPATVAAAQPGSARARKIAACLSPTPAGY
jgi:excisionase family DNA binding protein